MLHVSMPADVLVGWIRCPSGREELVAVSAADHDEYMKGALICPACGGHCGGSFEAVVVNSDIKVSRWNGQRWETAFLLGDRPPS